jgi:hypothetical protein
MNEDQDKSLLNLEEMLGEKKMKVIYKEHEYYIRNVNSLSPHEYHLVKRYGDIFASMTGSDLLGDGGDIVMEAIDETLEIIAPSLPRCKHSWLERIKRGYKRKFTVTLQEATFIFQFWAENSRPNAPRAVTPQAE